MVYEVQNDNISITRQYVSLSIIIINIIVFIVQLVDPEGLLFIEEAAFIPAEFFAGIKIWTIITSMFMHGGIFHILMNMIFFYVVSDNCEKAMGHGLFLFSYLISGICAALMHGFMALLDPQLANTPTLGASGAIFGIIAVYGILFPNNKLAFWFRFFIIQMKAKYFVIVYFLIQVAYGFLLWGASSTAYFAHIGGFIAGAVIALIFKILSDNY
ncbi:MAG: rhomboid family intramembrane serine protease [Promethearchaeia archaeon]